MISRGFGQSKEGERKRSLKNRVISRGPSTSEKLPRKKLWPAPGIILSYSLHPWITTDSKRLFKYFHLFFDFAKEGSGLMSWSLDPACPVPGHSPWPCCPLWWQLSHYLWVPVPHLAPPPYPYRGGRPAHA